MNYDVPNDATFAAVLVFALFAAVLAVIAERTHFFPRAVRWIQKDPVVRTALVVLLFAIGPITARTKNGQLSLPRPPLLLQVEEPASAPSIAPVTVHTNGVVLRVESTNAVEIAAFRTVGGTELGDWIETAAPFFAVGTNPVNRCFVSASGSVSFDSMRRPPVGSALPDGTGLPVLCPLRAPLGMVPEANWTNANTQSRFWHDALPGGGRVLTWENALVDRLPGRRVSLQVELLPTGDSVFRYDFHDELDPPPTNFVMGAQMGTNGVNALSILGTNILAATVWNMDGAPVTNGVSVADILCTNGVLRTPAAFEIWWRNTTGIDPDADTDGDGLTDWAEIFQLRTNPNHADTDGDGISDNVELMMGTDPFDADEDGDGVPDGTGTAAWADNALWASNASESAYSIAITLNSAIPAGASASLMVGSLCIPLRSPGSWTLGLVPGELYPYRLNVGGNVPVSLSIGPGGDAPPMRGSMNAMSIALWVDGMGGTFDGWSLGGSGNMAIPTLNVTWDDPDDGSHEGISGVFRRKTNPETAWLTLGAESALNSWTATIAGTFELRGRGVVDGVEVFTPITEIEVKFPSFDQITNDASVISMANAAWAATLADCSPTNQRERGFWIYLNTFTDTYEAGTLCLGEWTGGHGSGSVALPSRPSDETEPIAATDAGARYPVASFHTHTSPVFWRIGERTVGPSAADNRLDYIDRVPGLVFDYVEDAPGSQVIKWGHPLNAPAVIYKSLGVERRPTP